MVGKDQALVHYLTFLEVLRIFYVLDNVADCVATVLKLCVWVQSGHGEQAKTKLSFIVL